MRRKASSIARLRALPASATGNQRPRKWGGGIYNPDNADLDLVLDNLPGPLSRYTEHARVFLHFISTKRWTGDVDADGFARLHSSILAKYVPNRVFPALKNYLCEIGVLQTAPYCPKVRSTGYRILPAFDGPPRRLNLAHPSLRKKMQAWRESLVSAAADGPMRELIERRKPVLEHMHADLGQLALAKPASEIVAALTAYTDVDPSHARYLCQTIEHGDHDGLKVDPFGFRVHSIVTRASKRIRPYLRLRGNEFVELDVVNTQPLVLAILFLQPQLVAECTTYKGAQHSGRGAPPGDEVAAVLRPLLAGCSADVLSFAGFCQSGQLYEVLQARANLPCRENAKRELYRDVLFGKPHIRGPVTEAFETYWPCLLNAILQLKRQFGYKIIPLILQRLESRIMIDGACARLVREMPELPFLTIHDSILVPPRFAESVRRLIEQEFRAYGVGVSLRVKDPYASRIGQIFPETA